MPFLIDKRSLNGSIFLFCGILVALLLHITSLVFFLIFLFLFHLSFFRDPQPLACLPSQILSPAEGTIVEITTVQENRFLGQEAVKIGVFLSLFDAHVNRSPIEGTIQYMMYEPGKFFNAMKPEAVRENESLWMGIENASAKLLVRAISGAVARRICRDVSEKQHVTQGQKLGIICYGSRFEIYLPKASVKINVKLGQKLYLGRTVVGEWCS